MRFSLVTLHRAIYLSLLEGVLWILSVPAFATEYFAGPFASWLNVKTGYGATGNGATDDTAALQNAINASSASHSVVYLPPGTYKISSPLTIQNQLGFTFVGDDPSTTKIVWGGAAGGTMMQVLSTAMANWGRITWEGSSGGVSGVGAAIGVAYTCPGGNCNAGYGPTDLDHFDEVFQNMGKGIAGGQNGAPDNSEMTITRCTFQHCAFAGLSVESYNALDYWVWDSQFLNNREGITNEVNGGNFMAYRCLFENSSVSDLYFGNTGFFSFRNNTSIGSNQFLFGGGGSAPAEVSLQGNKILNTTNAVAVQMYNIGPLILVDNQILSAPGNTGPCVNMSCNGVASGGDLISIGNLYSVLSPITIVDTTPVTTTGYQAPRMWEQEDLTGTTAITSALPVMPPTATHLTANITDLPVGSGAASIQNAVNQAVALAGNHPVIHLPAGSYALNQTITVPANLDLLIVGDNIKTGLSLTGMGPIFQLVGPSRATVRDMGLSGSTGDAVQVLGADQAGSRVFAEGLYMDTEKQGDVLADTLANTHVDLQGIQPSRAGMVSVKSIGTGSPSASRVEIFGGAAGTTGGVAPTNGWMYEVANGGRMLVDDAWYESGSSPQIVNLTSPDSGVFGYWGGTLGQGSGGAQAVGSPIMVNGFDGQASFLALNLSLNAGSTIVVTNETSQTQALFLGLDGGPGANYFTRTGSGGTVVFDTNKNGGAQVPDLGNTRTSAFVDSQLALFRASADQEVPLTTDMPAGVTDARLYRLYFTNNGLALHVSSNNSTSPTATPSANSPTATGTVTGTATRTASATPTRTSTSTFTATPTATGTATPTVTSTWTATSTGTGTATRTSTATVTLTNSATPTGTSTFTRTATSTATETPTATGTWTATSTGTGTATKTFTATFTLTSTTTPTGTSTFTRIATPTATPTATSTGTPTSTGTWTATSTGTCTPTKSSTPTFTSSLTATGTATNTGTSTATWTLTTTATATPTATFTWTSTTTPSGTSTASFTATSTATVTASPTPTYTGTSSSTATGTSTFTATPTATSTATGTGTSTATGTWTVTETGTATSTSTPIRSTPTFTATMTSTFTPTFTTTTTNSPTDQTSPTYSPTASVSSSPTPTQGLSTVISAAYPNPSTGAPVSVDIDISSPSMVTLSVYTLSGRKVYQESLELTSDGSISWNLNDLEGVAVANGVYYLRIQVAGSQPLVKLLKVLILR